MDSDSSSVSSVTVRRSSRIASSAAVNSPVPRTTRRTSTSSANENTDTSPPRDKRRSRRLSTDSDTVKHKATPIKTRRGSKTIEAEEEAPSATPGTPSRAARRTTRRSSQDTPTIVEEKAPVRRSTRRQSTDTEKEPEKEKVPAAKPLGTRRRRSSSVDEPEDNVKPDPKTRTRKLYSEDANQLEPIEEAKESNQVEDAKVTTKKNDEAARSIFSPITPKPNQAEDKSPKTAVEASPPLKRKLDEGSDDGITRSFSLNLDKNDSDADAETSPGSNKENSSCTNIQEKDSAGKNKPTGDEQAAPKPRINSYELMDVDDDDVFDSQTSQISMKESTILTRKIETPEKSLKKSDVPTILKESEPSPKDSPSKKPESKSVKSPIVPVCRLESSFMISKMNSSDSKDEEKHSPMVVLPLDEVKEDDITVSNSRGSKRRRISDGQSNKIIKQLVVGSTEQSPKKSSEREKDIDEENEDSSLNGSDCIKSTEDLNKSLKGQKERSATAASPSDSNKLESEAETIVIDDDSSQSVIKIPSKEGDQDMHTSEAKQNDKSTSLNKSETDTASEKCEMNNEDLELDKSNHTFTLSEEEKILSSGEEDKSVEPEEKRCSLRLSRSPRVLFKKDKNTSLSENEVSLPSEKEEHTSELEKKRTSLRLSKSPKTFPMNEGEKKNFSFSKKDDEAKNSKSVLNETQKSDSENEKAQKLVSENKETEESSAQNIPVKVDSPKRFSLRISNKSPRSQEKEKEHNSSNKSKSTSLKQAEEDPSADTNTDVFEKEESSAKRISLKKSPNKNISLNVKQADSRNASVIEENVPDKNESIKDKSSRGSPSKSVQEITDIVNEASFDQNSSSGSTNASPNKLLSKLKSPMEAKLEKMEKCGVKVRKAPKYSDEINQRIETLLENVDMDSSDEDESEDNGINEFLDDMAEEGEESTPSEDSNNIEERGESIHSTDTEELESDEYDMNDSFIVEDEGGEPSPLSGEETYLEENVQVKSKSTKNRKRIIQPPPSSSDEEQIVSKASMKKRRSIKKDENPRQNEDVQQKTAEVHNISQVASNNSKVVQEDGEKSTNDDVKQDEAEIVEEKPETVETETNEEPEEYQINLIEDSSSESGNAEPEQVILNSSKNNQKIRSLFDMQCSTPNMSINETLNTSKQNKSSSIIVHENIQIAKINSEELSEKIKQVVEVFSSGIKSNTGNVSFNLSLDYYENEQENVESPKKKIKLDVSQEKVAEKSVPELKSPVKQVQLSEISNSELKKKSEEVDVGMSEENADKEELNKVEIVEQLPKKKNRNKRKRSKNKASQVVEKVEQVAKKEHENNDRRKQLEKSIKKEKLIQTSLIEAAHDLLLTAHTSSDQFGFKCENARKIETRSIKLKRLQTKSKLEKNKSFLKPSTSIASDSWIVNDNVNIKPSSSNSSKNSFDYKKINEKDFKNQCLYDPRIKREKSTNLAKRKGHFV